MGEMKMANEKRLISLDVAMEATHKEIWWTESQQAAVRSFLVKLPRVDAVEVVHGRWEHKKHKLFGNTYDYVCSVCGCDYALAEYNYCPNCGAKMDGDGNG
jgi:hypothetical protein